MKQILTLAILISIVSFSYSQTYSDGFSFNGKNRTFNVHIPALYSPTEAVPLILALHGLGDSGPGFQATGFSLMADTANFIVVYPTALFDQLLGGNAWDNDLNPFYDEDDVGFLNALIDSLSLDYNIDQDRVYATGYSMGGFMCHRLACQLSDRIAAIASVSGTLPQPIQSSCNPNRSIPIMHMHGTADATIAYDGSSPPFITSVDVTMDHWVAHNQCDASSVVTESLPDIASDSYTIDTYHWNQCEASSEVLLYKINNGPHTWLGPSNDVFATQEIWTFLRKHTRTPEFTNTASVFNEGFSVSPNPFQQTLRLKTGANKIERITLFNSLGQTIWTKETNWIEESEYTLNVPQVPLGVYWLRVENADAQETIKLVGGE